MKFPRPASRGPIRYALAGGLALLATGLVTGCDSRVGIEGTDYSTDDAQPPATSVTSVPTTATAAAAPIRKPKPGELAVTVALAEPDPNAADALTRWAMDLHTLPTNRLERKCWTLAPQNVQSMYTDKQAILGALARPGVDDGTAITWQGTGRGAVTVVAQRTDIATGYACPRVFPAGTTPTFDDADARHTVRRYLDRVTGTPIDPADKESTHPLRCPATPGTWDPSGTGRATAPPLTADSGALDDVQSFVDQSLTSETLRGPYTAVSVSVLTSAGTEQTRTFTLKSGQRGYCIGGVSA